MTASIMSASTTTNFEAIGCALRDVRRRYRRNSRLVRQAIADRSGADPRREFSLLDDRVPNPRRECVNHEMTLMTILFASRARERIGSRERARDAIQNQSRS
jgi:hypothetical protein